MQQRPRIPELTTVTESYFDKVYEPLNPLQNLMRFRICNLCNLICNLPKNISVPEAW